MNFSSTSLHVMLPAFVVAAFGCHADLPAEVDLAVFTTAAGDDGSAGASTTGDPPAYDGSTGPTGATEPDEGGGHEQSPLRVEPPECDRPRLAWIEAKGQRIAELESILGVSIERRPLHTDSTTRGADVVAIVDFRRFHDPRERAWAAKAALVEHAVDADYECPAAMAMTGKNTLPWPGTAARELIPRRLDVIPLKTLPKDLPWLHIVDIGESVMVEPSLPCDDVSTHRCAVETAARYACSSAGIDCDGLHTAHYNVPEISRLARSATGYLSDVAQAVELATVVICRHDDPAVLLIPLAWSSECWRVDQFFKSAIQRAQACGAAVVVPYGNHDQRSCGAQDLNKYPSAYADELGLIVAAGSDLDGAPLPNSRPNPPLLAPGIWWQPDTSRPSRIYIDTPAMIHMTSLKNKTDPRPWRMVWSGSSIGAANVAGNLALVQALTGESFGKVRANLTGMTTYSMRTLLNALTGADQAVGNSDAPYSYAAVLLEAARESWALPAYESPQNSRIVSLQCEVYSPLIDVGAVVPEPPDDDFCTDVDPFARPMPSDRACTLCSTSTGKKGGNLIADGPTPVQTVLNLRPAMMKDFAELASRERRKLGVRVRIQEVKKEPKQWVVAADGVLETSSAVIDATLEEGSEEVPLMTWLEITAAKAGDAKLLHVEPLGRVLVNEAWIEEAVEGICLVPFGQVPVAHQSDKYEAVRRVIPE